MVVAFGEDWAAEIAAVTGSEEYQNAVIEIRDPSLVERTYNVDTGWGPQPEGNPVLYTGPARVVGMRAAWDSSDASAGNPTGIKGVRVQIDTDAYNSRINRGLKLRVLDGGRNVVLTTYEFSVESDVNSSHMATRTIEASIDLDAVVGG